MGAGSLLEGRTGCGLLGRFWVNRRSAMEYAGFLEYIWRVKDMPFRVVDVTGVAVLCLGLARGDTIPQSLDITSPEQIVASGMVDRATVLSSRQRDAYLANWARLRAENAPLRIVKDTGLVSAPIDAFDHEILSRVTSDWKVCARVVGECLADSMDSPFLQVGDSLLFARLRALVGSGVLEAQGNASNMREYLVRLS